MLVLSRKVEEVIRIGDDIEIKVLEVLGNRVRVGITAPRDVVVHREEIWHLAHASSASPSRSAPAPLAVGSRR